ncbi:MAG TPA: Sir2 family NAD-dependent protein deacetylase [Acidimicrobiales bacterium]|nr:Sir2 family NAD-dependent protein deacetylase [Acidimicrobiales bacterium]
MERARALIEQARRIVVLTGAGISTDSGIPDFRGPNGVWTRDPKAEKASQLQHYLADPEVRRLAWRNRAASPMWEARPNAGHVALVGLERGGVLDTLVTQNIDGLHLMAGHDPAKVIEIHGTARFVTCWGCGERGPMEPVLERVRAGEDDPACHACGGILKSATISFGQSLVLEDLQRAEAAARRCDLMLAVGSTLVVHPAAGLVPVALAAGAALVVVNAEATPYDHHAAAVIREPISRVLPGIVPGARPRPPAAGPG